MSGTGCSALGERVNLWLIAFTCLSGGWIWMDVWTWLIKLSAGGREGEREGPPQALSLGESFPSQPQTFLFCFSPPKKWRWNFTFERRLKFIQPANALCHYLRAANCLGNARRWYSQRPWLSLFGCVVAVVVFSFSLNHFTVIAWPPFCDRHYLPIFAFCRGARGDRIKARLHVLQSGNRKEGF